MTLTHDSEPWRCLMLHAAGSSPRALGRLIGKLEDRGIAVTAPALPMRIMRENASGGTPFTPHVALAKSALEDFGPARRIIVGHSFGALVALLSLLEGASIDLAILYEPIVLSVLDGGDEADLAAKHWDRALIDHLSECVSLGEPERGISRFIEAYNEVSWSRLPERARSSILAEAPHIRDVAHAVHHLNVSTEALMRLDRNIVVMSGSRSLDVARRMAIRVSRFLPRATHVVIPGGGHMAPALLADPVAEAIFRALDERAVRPRRSDVPRP